MLTQCVLWQLTPIHWAYVNYFQFLSSEQLIIINCSIRYRGLNPYAKTKKKFIAPKTEPGTPRPKTE
jgi:hypothetical protein